MPVITRLSQLFAKKQSANVIGISLRQQSWSFCQLPETLSAQSFSQKNGDDITGVDNSALKQSSCETHPLSTQSFKTELSAIAQNHQLTGECHLVLSSNLTQIVQVDKPNVPEHEITSALKWQLKDLVTIPADNLVLDYFDSPELINTTNKINVVCAPLTELKELAETLNGQGLKLSSIITEEFAFARLLPVKDEATLFVCQQKGEEIILLIVKSGRLFFHRRLRGFSQIADKEEHELAMGVLDTLSLEIQRSTDYFERQLKQAPIKEILLLLPMKNERFVADKLSENTLASVNIFEFPADCEDKREFSCALGATLPEVESQS